MPLESDQEQAMHGLECQGKEIIVNPIDWSVLESLRQGCSIIRFA